MEMSNNSNDNHSFPNNSEVSQGSAGIPGKDDDKKLFVGGLSRQTTERELREYFSKFGPIESISIKINPFTGVSRGFAFIVFDSIECIEMLLECGDHYINKRKVDPKKVLKKGVYWKIFVGGLTPEISESDIREYFNQHGTVVEIESPFDKRKNQRKGFCFVTFDSKDTVNKLLKMPKQNIKGKEVDVRKVKVNVPWDYSTPGWHDHPNGYFRPSTGYDYNNYMLNIEGSRYMIPEMTYGPTDLIISKPPRGGGRRHY